MKYESLVKLIGEPGFFDLAMVLQLSGEKRESLWMQLHRWSRSGKLIPLRRGMYALPKTYSRRAINAAELANRLYTPSYLSTYWTLAYYDLIPEKVTTYTSVTSRVPRTFENHFGVFQYSHIKSAGFFGYQSLELGNSKVLVATPEKALIDLWHLQCGEWNAERMYEMRFQNVEQVNPATLREHAIRFSSPRLLRAVDAWVSLPATESTTTVEL